ncbi:threonine-phosphate decarboxylase CobD [Rhodocyclaceae bacterium SMB388]
MNAPATPLTDALDGPVADDTRPVHGGRLRQAAREYGIPLSAWLDLSTGINPRPYPPPALPLSAWTRLPEDDDGLETAAAAYYGTADLLPVAGSQAAIQALPAVLPGNRVTIVGPTYAEHAHAWRGRTLHHIGPDALASAAASDIVVVVNPDNPTGRLIAPEDLLALHDGLARRGGWLIVDEAFIDPYPEASLAAHVGAVGLVVLRSLGKFFGLAGARVGFVLAPASLRDALARQLGPWTLSGPAREVARAALADSAWQGHTRTWLAGESRRLLDLLRRAGLAEASTCALFCQARTEAAGPWHTALARLGILVRHFDQPPRLRFGLPGTEAEWQRLETALTTTAGLLAAQGQTSVPAVEARTT